MAKASVGKNWISFVAIVLSVLCQPSLAQVPRQAAPTHENPYTGETESDYPEGYKPEVGVVSILGGNSAAALMFQADYMLKLGKFEQAIALCKLSLAQDNEDSDTHCIYAQALEKKLRAQVTRDPKLFNKCVKEWLIIMREEKGPEKGLYWHGFATPYGRSFGDEDHSLLAAQHLYKLTGTVPRNGQSDKKYLMKVLKPTTTEVRGKVLNGKEPEPEKIKLADEKAEEEEDDLPTKKKSKKAQPHPAADE
jgi:tetratricopeptide (TPR) repeat protein